MRLTSAASSVAATLTALTLTAASASGVDTAPVPGASTTSTASASSYVALGDSYSSGTGTRASTGDCYRSPYGYPRLVADAAGLSLDYQACSGATTADLLSRQIGAVTAETDYVSVTIGGNDVGFASVITACALPGWMGDCFGKLSTAQTVLRSELPARLDSVYGGIRTRAPQATVAVAGYPLLFNGTDCSLATFFSAEEMRQLNASTHELNSLVSQRASAAGHRFVDVRSTFAGHAWCDSSEWINGLSMPVEESYHPNRAGNQGYAGAVTAGLGVSSVSSLSALAGMTKTSTGPTSSSPGHQSMDLDTPMAADGTGATDAALRAQASQVLAMHLDSTKNLRRAAAEGVNPSAVRRAVAQLRSPHTERVLAGLQELQALEAAWEAQQSTR